MKNQTFFIIVFFFTISFLGCETDSTSAPSKEKPKNPTGERIVGTTNQLQNAVSAAGPGDVIALKDGTYASNFILNITNSGTSGSTITIKALNPGKAKFTGAAGINLDARYVKLSGFDFNGGTVNAANENTIILIKKGNNIIEDIRMINISNGDVSKHRYIYFRTGASTNCIVRRCWLESEGKKNDGIKIFGNIPDGSSGTFNTIENSFLNLIKGREMAPRRFVLARD